MKKLIYLFIAFIGLAITGCEPMEDVQDEINAELDSERAVADREYTLTEDDYSAIGLNFPNFNSEDDARELIPTLLETQYPNYGAGSSVSVTFDIYDPMNIDEYAVTSQDYEDAGVTYFPQTSAISSFLVSKFPSAERGDIIELTYQGVAANDTIEITSSSDYDLIGEEFATDYPDPAENVADHHSFEIRSDRNTGWSESMIREALTYILSTKDAGVSGMIYEVVYRTYNGSSGSSSMSFRYDGNAYVAVTYGEEYVFQESDTTAVEAALISDYPDAVGNLNRYGNFNLNNWDKGMIIEAAGAVLLDKFPYTETGDKYLFRYEYYDGDYGDDFVSVVYDGEEFVEDIAVSVIEMTNPFYYNNDAWMMPLILESEDYTAMGQRYPNFDDSDEALYKIAIFLGLEYPYAMEGDFVSVSYQFYSGSTSTRYTNFEFVDGAFNPISSVRTSSLQFGNVDGEWVPDNTIRYSLVGSDYTTIADALEESYSGPVASMARYNNFDRRSGNSAYWSDEMILEAMQILLNRIAPNAEVGQKYVLTYEIYNGSNGTEDISLIKNEAGEWVINE